MHFKGKLTREEREFRGFTGATIEESISSDYGPEDWYNYIKTIEGKQVVRKENIKRAHGITIDDYNKLFEKQGGVCAICFEKPIKRRHAVDHNHSTGKIRGLLCHNCNMALGLLKESPELLDRAKAYLKFHINI